MVLVNNNNNGKLRMIDQTVSKTDLFHSTVFITQKP